MLLSDFDLWSRVVVHYRYIPVSDDDQVAFERRIRRSLSLLRSEPIPPINSNWPVPLVRALVESWTLVFDVAPGRPTQGTVERVCLEDIVEALPAPELADVPFEYHMHRSTYQTSSG